MAGQHKCPRRALLSLVTLKRQPTALSVPSWRAVFGQYLRWSCTVTQAVVLSVVTFCIILPLCCHQLLYSYFFIKSLYLESMSEEVLQASLSRGQEALHFWQSASAVTTSSRFSEITQNPELLVTVVTVRRNEGWDFHYLLQVMWTLSSIVESCGKQRCAEVLVCDVDTGPQENQDAKLLEGHLRVIQRSPPGAAEDP